MTRRCSHCSNNGHNSRTCPTRGSGGPGSNGGSGSGAGVKLFGVRLTDGSIMKKSASMGNLSGHYNSSSSAAASPNHPGSPSSDPYHDPVHLPDGYASDDPTNANRRGERKKGVPWTEEEHRLFLLGLQQLGKGDWRGISRNFVTSRTPTQVASHAQKYFIRQSNATRRKRRSSLFDMVPESADSLALTEEQYMLPPQVVDSSKQQLLVPHSQALEDDNEKSQPSLDLSLKPDLEPMEATPSEPVEEDTKEIVTPLPEVPSVFPSFFPAFIPVPFPMWPSNATFQDQGRGAEVSQHKILKPIPVLPKEPINVDELVGMSHLSLRDVAAGPAVPSPLSLTLTAEPSRQSAFHASTPVKETTISKEESIIKAV